MSKKGCSYLILCRISEPPSAIERGSFLRTLNTFWRRIQHFFVIQYCRREVLIFKGPLLLSSISWMFAYSLHYRFLLNIRIWSFPQSLFPAFHFRKYKLSHCRCRFLWCIQVPSENLLLPCHIESRTRIRHFSCSLQQNTLDGSGGICTWECSWCWCRRYNL